MYRNVHERRQGKGNRNSVYYSDQSLRIITIVDGMVVVKVINGKWTLELSDPSKGTLPTLILLLLLVFLQLALVGITFDTPSGTFMHASFSSCATFISGNPW